MLQPPQSQPLLLRNLTLSTPIIITTPGATTTSPDASPDPTSDPSRSGTIKRPIHVRRFRLALAQRRQRTVLTLSRYPVPPRNSPTPASTSHGDDDQHHVNHGAHHRQQRRLWARLKIPVAFLMGSRMWPIY